MIPKPRKALDAHGMHRQHTAFEDGNGKKMIQQRCLHGFSAAIGAKGSRLSRIRLLSP